MKITYDPEADAAYFYICEKIHEPETRQIDGDIYLDFDEGDRLVGVEVLAASQRLNLNELLPQLQIGHEKVTRRSERCHPMQDVQDIPSDK